MYHLVPTLRRNGSKKVRLQKICDMELTETGVVVELEIADIETAEVGKILVSGDVINSPLYLKAMAMDHFLVWEEDIEWVRPDEETWGRGEKANAAGLDPES